MKKTLRYLAITFLLLNAQNLAGQIESEFVPQIISHSTSQIVEQRAVACFNDEFGFTFINSYWRSYTLSEFGISGNRLLTGAQFGYSFEDNSGSDPLIQVVVTAYLVDGVFPSGGLSFLTSGVANINVGGSFTIAQVTFLEAIEIQDDQEIAIEVTFPDGFEFPIDIRVGQNDDGETAPSYFSTPDCGGIGIVTFTDIGWPGNAIINMVIDNELAVQDNQTSPFLVYPNPVSDVVTIQAPNVGSILQVTLHNMLGKKLATFSSPTVDLSSFSAGIYLLNIKSDSGTFVHRVVKM